MTALVSSLEKLEAEIRRREAEIVRRAKKDATARRLMAIPGVGPLIATALVALAPPPQTFRRERDFAAWLGLTPRQHSTGGKPRLGATTRMGERSLRRLLIIGANSVIIKRGVYQEIRPGTWLAGMLSRKPPLLVRVALANKMARIAARPEVLDQRRTCAEHPFGSIKQWMNQGAFLMQRLENVRGEFSLTALAYNIRRAITLVGVPGLIAAAKA